jgi:hypothetical protein
MPLSAWNVYVWLPHLLPPVGPTKEVRAIVVLVRWAQLLDVADACFLVPVKVSKGSMQQGSARSMCQLP